MIRLLLACLLLTAFASAQEELLRNGDFSQAFDKHTNWEPVLHREYVEAKATPATIKGAGTRAYVQAKVDVKSAAPYYNIQQDVPLNQGTTYRLTFEARTLGEGIIRFALWNTAGKKNAGMGFNPKTDKTWRRYEVIFTPHSISTEQEPKFVVGFGATKGLSHVRKFSLVTTDLPAGKRKGGTGKEIPMPGAGPTVELPVLLAEFANDAAAAGASYKDKFVPISSPVVAATRGPNASTFVFTLEFGKVKLVGLGSELGPEGLKELAAALKTANAKAAAMRKSPKWSSFSPEEKDGHLRGVYPTLHASATITGYKGGVLQCGRSQDLAVTYP